MSLAQKDEPELPAGPIDRIDDVLWACAPDVPVPPGHPYYVDLQGLRHDNIQRDLERAFTVVRPRSWLHRCLCGHRGSGKSTELLRFMGWAFNNGFLPVRMEVYEHLGTIPLEFSDLCLLTVMQVERELMGMGGRLPRGKVRGVVEWFSEIIHEHKDHVTSELALETQAQLKNEIPLLGHLLAKFTAGVKAGSSHAKVVRDHLRNFPDALRDRTNDLLDTAAEILQSQGKARGLLLVFDQLDRYEPNVIDRVLVLGGDLIRSLHCHAVYTVPIALHYSPISGKLEDNYGPTLEVPMAALRPRGARWSTSIESSSFDEKATQHFGQVVTCRLSGQLFTDPSSVLRIVRASGGCVREVMHLVNLAFSYADDRFTPEAIERAIRRYRLQLSEQLEGEDYKLLARIARQESVERSDRYQRLLNIRYALVYHAEGVSWRDVHPLVVEIEEFQRAYSESSPIQT